jgi:hypothetical protein
MIFAIGPHPLFGGKITRGRAANTADLYGP